MKAREVLELSKSVRGGWNLAQLELLGVSLPLSRGWRRKIAEKEIDPETAKLVVSMKDAHTAAWRLMPQLDGID